MSRISLSSCRLKENRRKSETPTPWELITDDPAEIEQIERATREPKLMLVSDWTRFKSWEYMEAEEKSALTILCVTFQIARNGIYPFADYQKLCRQYLAKWQGKRVLPWG